MSKGLVGDGVVYHAGFPNAGEDSNLSTMSLDKLLVSRPASTFFWRLESSIAELHWPAGSLVIVDRSLSPSQNRKVVAVIDDDFVVATYKKDGLYDLGGHKLGEDAQLWGIISYVIHEV